ncbi:MAG: hypothetical protein WKF89_11250 [Chitinophagaceae bacterium]
MKKLFVFLFFIPLAGMTQDKNVINVTRVFPKSEKIGEFEKALTAHAQKFHTGDWKWRVSEIQSGPDAGGYSIVEGPHNWDQIDKRGNLGAEHQDDWNKSLAINLTDKYQSSFAEYKEELGNGQLTDYSDKYAVNHVFIRPGMYGAALVIFKNLRKTWAADKQLIVVYEASSSGPQQFLIVTRYKTGLKERQSGFLKPMSERYEAANGAGSFQKYNEAVQKVVDHSWSELLFTRMDLSSK